MGSGFNPPMRLVGKEQGDALDGVLAPAWFYGVVYGLGLYRVQGLGLFKI